MSKKNKKKKDQNENDGAPATTAAAASAPATVASPPDLPRSTESPAVPRGGDPASLPGCLGRLAWMLYGPLALVAIGGAIAVFRPPLGLADAAFVANVALIAAARALEGKLNPHGEPAAADARARGEPVPSRAKTGPDDTDTESASTRDLLVRVVPVAIVGLLVARGVGALITAVSPAS